jgi:hypothetical protein
MTLTGLPRKLEYNVCSMELVLWRVVPLPCNEREKEHVAKQRLGKHIPAETISRLIARLPPITTIERLLEAMFSVGSSLRLYSDDPRMAESAEGWRLSRAQQGRSCS